MIEVLILKDVGKNKLGQKDKYHIWLYIWLYIKYINIY